MLCLTSEFSFFLFLLNKRLRQGCSRTIYEQKSLSYVALDVAPALKSSAAAAILFVFFWRFILKFLYCNALVPWNTICVETERYVRHEVYNSTMYLDLVHVSSAVLLVWIIFFKWQNSITEVARLIENFVVRVLHLTTKSKTTNSLSNNLLLKGVSVNEGRTIPTTKLMIDMFVDFYSLIKSKKSQNARWIYKQSILIFLFIGL